MSEVQNIIMTDEMREGDTLKGNFLTFWTDGQLFGVPIADVVQIIGVQEITAIPEFPSYAKGVINLRGSIIPVIDMRLRLHKEEKEYDERTCIIVTSIKDVDIGFIVDSVNEVSKFEDEQISPPPAVSVASEAAVHNYLTGIGKKDSKVVLLLDTPRVLSDDDFSQLAAG